MKNRAKILVCAGAVAVAAVVACIIPDKDIQVIIDDCGEEWAASTAGAQGRNGIGEWDPIKTEDDDWIARQYCLTPAQGAELTDTNSALYIEMWDYIVFLCEERATELGLADPTCADEATIAYVDTCPNSGDCGGDETGDGGAETGGEDPPKLDGLDLTQEVELENGTYIVSASLIEAALDDPVGLMEDGTTAEQVLDATG